MGNELTLRADFTKDQLELIKTTICKGSTNDELKLFIEVCKKTQLDPFTKQIYAVKRKNKKTNKEEMAIQISIDGSRLIAERSGVYEGQEGPFWCGEDGKWVDVWLDKNKPPSAAKVGVWKRGFRSPVWGVANWEAYVQTGYEGRPSMMWEKMPETMIAKCAESLALRKAFPNDLSGIYTNEEMQQADAPKAEAKPVEVKAVLTENTPPGEFEVIVDENWAIPDGSLKGVVLKDRDKQFWARYVLDVKKALETRTDLGEFKPVAEEIVTKLELYLS